MVALLFEQRLAVASSANYGLVGNGRLHILSLARNASAPHPSLVVDKVFDTQDGLYDVAFSEAHENQLVTASGDGSIKLWDCALQDHPIRNWQEHNRGLLRRLEQHQQKRLCQLQLGRQRQVVASRKAQQHHGHHRAYRLRLCMCFLLPHIRPTCSLQRVETAICGCLTCANQPRNPRQPVPVGGEVLCLDWNKYRPMTIATGSTDRVIKTWDLRNAVSKPPGAMASPLDVATPLAAILGHEYAVRKVPTRRMHPSCLRVQATI